MSKSAYPFRPSAQATDDDSDQNPGQAWDQLLGGSVPRGLSGLGLSTRVAVYQLSCDRGVSWLQRHLNPDGSIGSDPDDWIFVRTHHLTLPRGRCWRVGRGGSEAGWGAVGWGPR